MPCPLMLYSHPHVFVEADPQIRSMGDRLLDGEFRLSPRLGGGALPTLPAINSAARTSRADWLYQLTKVVIDDFPRGGTCRRRACLFITSIGKVGAIVCGRINVLRRGEYFFDGGERRQALPSGYR